MDTVHTGTALTADRDRILVQPAGTTDPRDRVWVPKVDAVSVITYHPAAEVGPFGVVPGTPVEYRR